MKVVYRFALVVFTAALVAALALAAMLPVNAAPPLRPGQELSDGLVSYWKFDESGTSITSEDSSGANDLSADSAVLFTDGHIGNAVSFTSHGQDDEFYVVDNATLDLTGSGFTVSAWFYDKHRGESCLYNDAIVTKTGDSPNYEWHLWGNCDDEVAFAISSNGTDYTTVTTTEYTDDWHFVVAWLDIGAGTINVQIDNATIYSETFSGDVRDGTARLEFGGWGTTYEWQDSGMDVDEVGLWSRVLGDAERLALYNAGIGCTYPFSDCDDSVPVWHVGNYVEDDSFEGINWFEDVFNPRWQTLGNIWNGSADGALCGNYYKRMRTSTAIAGYETYTIQPYGMWQTDILWWGGDMYISFGYRTDSGTSLTAYLIDPFNQRVPVATSLTYTSGWKVFYDNLGDMPLGRYKIVFEGNTNNIAAKIDVDAVSISEAGYVHCAYNSAPSTPPPDAPVQISRLETPSESTEPMAIDWNLPDSAASSGSGWNQVIAISPIAAAATNPMQALYETPVVASENVVEVLYNSPVAPKGFTLENLNLFLPTNIGKVLTISWVFSEYQRHAIGLQSVETGEMVPIDDVFTQIDPDTGWYTYEAELTLVPGKYRVIFMNENLNTTVYLTKVCVSPYSLVITSNCNGAFQFVPPAGATTTAMAAQVTAVSAATQTAQAQTTSTAYAQWQATATPRAATTQTALAASSNATSIAQATQTQAWALTATPRYVATQTAWVGQFRATQTAQAGATRTQSSLKATANAQGSLNATAQAALQQTAYAQTTIVAQQTGLANYQATIQAGGTAQVQNQPTVDFYSTAAAATLSAAQTALAAQSNATTQAQATAAAAYRQQVDAQATAYANQQATLIAQMTAAGQTNLTLVAQATTIAQQQATLIATLQMQATQQALQYPSDQPRPEELDPEIGCTPPDNPINLAWWIDYSVCRILWYFTPNSANAQQIRDIGAQVSDYEPWGTVVELGGAYDDLRVEWQKYDWYLTGLEGAQDEVTIVDSSLATPPPGDVVILRQATSVPLLMGDLQFDDPNLNYVFALDCELRLEENIGPYLTPPICFLIDVMRSTGWLPIVRIAFDIGAIILLIKWADRSLKEFVGENSGPPAQG